MLIFFVFVKNLDFLFGVLLIFILLSFIFRVGKSDRFMLLLMLIFFFV